MPRGLILGIESSCDETAAAVVERGSRTLSSVVASQIATHLRYGGVVPELASREHLRAIVPLVRASLAEAHISLGDLDAIAVTSGPGLAGALLVGITYAKALAFARGLPLIAINHLEGHIHAVLLEERSSELQILRCAQDDNDGLDSWSPTLSAERSGKDGARRFGASDPMAGRDSFGGSGAQDDSRVRGEAEDEPALALVVSGGHTHL